MGDQTEKLIQCGATTSRNDKCRRLVSAIGLRCSNHNGRNDEKPRCNADKSRNKGKCKIKVDNIGDRCIYHPHPDNKKNHLRCGALNKGKGLCEKIVYSEEDNCTLHGGTKDKTKKRCKVCDELKKFSDFHSMKGGSNNVSRTCKLCTNNRSREINNPKPISGIFQCVKCGKLKDVCEFNHRKISKNGLNSMCMICTNINRVTRQSELTKYIRHLFSGIKSHCRNHDLELTITEQEIIDLYNLNNVCAKTGKVMTHHKKYDPNKKTRIIEDHYYNLSVDRIDSSKGYTRDNIQIVCIGYNLMKSNLNEDYMLNICRRIEEHKKNHPKAERLNRIDLSTTSFISNLYKKIINEGWYRTKDIDISITFDDLIELYKSCGGKCSLSGIELTTLTMSRRKGYLSTPRKERGNNLRPRKYFNISIDRIDPSGPYSADNVQLVCSIINMMKLEMSQSTFLDLCQSAAEHNKEEQ
uniref:Zn-finger protein n=1 Tax=Pithovirus LCPAC401 TaxID=2506595 RepID=A0A481ZBB7_9VIRU|nr:MAG: uncharacterized protein LCPAC401_00170 [Pithovirus LCPAC401]